MNSVFGTVPKLWTISHRCRCDGTTGQVSVLHITKGTGAYTPLFSLSSLLIISVQTGKEVKVKTELVILCQQLQTVDWGCLEKNTNSS